MAKQLFKETEKITTQKTEMVDTHCHLDLVSDRKLIDESILHGVRTIITDGVSTKTNISTLEIADNRHIFPALGIDPENAMLIGAKGLDSELAFNYNMIKENRNRIVAIGEIGLDYKKADTSKLVEQQKKVFIGFLQLAKELDLPVSVHSRESMDDILAILKENSMEKVHLHFFEGNVQQAKQAEREGYLISVPPIESSRRKQVIKFVSIDSLVVESDAPVVGASPKFVEVGIKTIAGIKGISFENAAGLLTTNAKKFFGIYSKTGFMRS